MPVTPGSAWRIAVAALGLFACTSAPAEDAGTDAGRSDAAHDASSLDVSSPDAGTDAGVDAGADAGSDAPVVDAGSDAGLDAGPCATSIDALATRIAQATCAQAARCDLVRQISTGLTDCVAQRTYALTTGPYYARYRQAIARGTLTLDGCALEACATAVEAEDCYGRAALIPLATDPACDRMFVGHIADGDHCTLDGECGVTSRCPLVPPGVCPGARCEHAPQLGESCASAGCDLGLWCDLGRTCRALIARGAACDASSSQFMCAGGSQCAAGHCVTRAPALVGQSCAPIGTAYVFCDVGLVCDPTTSLCRAARTDGTCTADGVAPIVTRDCPLGTRCVIASGVEGACVDPCASITCAPAAANGASCAHDWDCASEHCGTSVCSDAPLCPTP